MDTRSATALSRRLLDLGVSVSSGYSSSPVEDLEPGIPERATITRGRNASDMTLLYSPSMTLTELGRYGLESIGGHILLLGERINERSAETLRRIGANFLDEAGNAFISFENVHIDVRGRRAETKRHERSSSLGAANLFSTKRSQVIFALLAWPELRTATLRRVAARAGVSLGQAQKTLNELHEAGYLADDGELSLGRQDELLDRWAAAFPTGLGSPQRTRMFTGDIGSLEAPPGVSALLSGESAVSHRIRPETLTVYVDDDSVNRLIAKNRWRTDRRPNIFVRTLFWEDPEAISEGIGIAPPVLVYADLLASGDGRQAEVARSLRQGDA
ncbi:MULTISPECIES: type IV toxin-antitoxin system AbiEi family antitoxin [Microbacterium]|uniref:type IV toxin-antitoxin system AbiEi family antitoxin n=1 Tax=Microbacterium TaxID=33882 RepID=UPI001CC166F0|nr:type IV toxin-antitoxin system AbiEi family antitoxin [Microbacterium sp. OVT16B]